MRMTAAKRLTYKTRRLLPGDEFEVVKPIHARILAKRKKAVASINRNPGKIGPPPAKLVAKAAAQIGAPDGSEDFTKLRADAEALGIVVDGRWGLKRLHDEIDAKLSA
ncbi:hypothetical protein V1291_000039 [Nitrobacteraceae bacterium AZCC 1564]